MRRRSMDFGKLVFVFLALTLGWVLAQSRVTGSIDGYTAGAADIVAETREGVMWLPVDLGRGTLGADGSFSLTLRPLEEVPTEVFLPITSLFPEGKCEGLTVSDAGAQVVPVRGLRVIPQGASCEYCGTLGTAYAASQPRGSLPRTGDLSGNWFLADRAVTVSGTCTYGWGQEVYDLTLEKGWNPVVLETATVQPTTDSCDCVTMRVEQRALPSDALIWHFQPYQ